MRQSLQEYLEESIENILKKCNRDKHIHIAVRRNSIHYARAWLETLGEYTDSEQYEEYDAGLDEAERLLETERAQSWIGQR